MMGCYWYTFIAIGGADPLDPNNYGSPTSIKPSCPGSIKICAIFACDDGFGRPIITQIIIIDIVRALQFGTDQTTVALRS